MSSPSNPPDPALPSPTTTSPSPASAVSFAAPATSTATMAAPTVYSLPNFLPSPNHYQQHQQILDTVPIRPKPSPHGVLYPVASSGLAFIPHKSLPHSERAVTIANPNPGNRPVLPFTPSQHLLRPPHATTAVLPASMPPRATQSPARSSKSVANGFKDTRDRGKDDSLIVVRDRKVRLSDGDSLYGLGRSWLRNGFPDERMVWHSQYEDFAKILPRPLPMTVADSSHSLIEEGDKEENKEENVDGLSAKDLLEGHIKRAKRVRLRAKEERRRRISRVTTRIRLLLSPLEGEQLRSDSASGT